MRPLVPLPRLGLAALLGAGIVWALPAPERLDLPALVAGPCVVIAVMMAMRGAHVFLAEAPCGSAGNDRAAASSSR